MAGNNAKDVVKRVGKPKFTEQSFEIGGEVRSRSGDGEVGLLLDLLEGVAFVQFVAQRHRSGLIVRRSSAGESRTVTAQRLTGCRVGVLHLLLL